MEIRDIPFKKFGPQDNYRPWLPVRLINPHAKKDLHILGLIDTGADECALPARFAILLGHNLESGIVREIGTGNGKTTAYSHTMQIEINNIRMPEVLIDFLPNLHVPLLGVKSFLSNFVVTIDYPALKFSLLQK